MVTTRDVQANWETLRDRIKKRWEHIKEEDLAAVSGGDVDQLIARIQQKTGEQRQAIETFLNDAIQRSQSAFNRASETVSTYAHETAGRFREGYGQVRGRAQQGLTQAEHVVQDHPAESLALCFGVGLVFGVMVGLALFSSD